MSWSVLLVSLLASQPLWAAPTVAARIDGEPVYQADLDQWMKEEKARGHEPTTTQALETLIRYRLSLKEAKRRKLDHQPEVRQAADRALYRVFLGELKKESPAQGESPTREQLQSAYEASPLIRLRHLVLLTDTAEHAAKADERLKEIRTALGQGADFKNLVLKHSDDPTAGMNAGDLDYRGRNSLDPLFYEAGLKLSPGEVSPPLKEAGAVHLLQLIDRKPFGGAFAPYLAYLEDRCREERDRNLLDGALTKLRQRAKVEIVGAHAP